jgi:flagellar hook-basal body complex protein FliE
MKNLKDFNLKTALEEAIADQGEEHLNDELSFDDLSSEEIQYCSEEINKALEAICSLNDLKLTLEKQEVKGIAIESYAEVAAFGYNNILRSIGLENSTLMLEPGEDGVYSPNGKSGSSFSEKVKAAIEKIIEVIKKVAAKILEFMRNAFKTVLDKTVKAKNSIEKLLDEGAVSAIKLRGIKTIDIESPIFFKDRRLVDCDLVYKTHTLDAALNFQLFNNKLLRYSTASALFPTIGNFDDQMEKANHLNSEFIQELKGKRSSKHGVCVTPEGYIDAVKESEDSISKITFSKHDPQKTVEKQTLALVSLDEKFLREALETLDYEQTKNQKARDNATKLMEDELEGTLKSMKDKIDKEQNEYKREKLLNQAKTIKLSIGQLNSYFLTNVRYVNDYSNMLLFYGKYVEKAAAKSE